MAHFAATVVGVNNGPLMTYLVDELDAWPYLGRPNPKANYWKNEDCTVAVVLYYTEPSTYRIISEFTADVFLQIVKDSSREHYKGRVLDGLR